jgi:hypothetical protein
MQYFAATKSIPNSYDDLLLATAKVHWMNGNFKKSQEICESILSTYNDLEETFPTTNLHMAAAMTGKALSQLADMKSLDDAYSVRDYFRVAVKFLERHPPTENSLPRATVLSNCGAAEAIYNIFLEETNDVSVPMDSALRMWFQALQKSSIVVDAQGSNTNLQILAASKFLQASIQANLAWGVLNYEQDRSDRLSKASDYAKKALSVYDTENVLGKEGIPRVLSVLASCYHQADSAVTAEGLFQSAIDRKGLLVGTSALLQLQDAYLQYAELCRRWEKREGDARNLVEEAKAVEQCLPTNWQGKSGLHGSLWFWTPGEML